MNLSRAIAFPSRIAVALTLTIALMVAIAGGGEARAGVGAYQEPAFTKTLTNTWFFNYSQITGTTNEYFICFTLRRNGAVIEPSNGLNGPSSQNCTANMWSASNVGFTREYPGGVGPDAINMPMTVGATYEMCGLDYYSFALIWKFGGSGCQATTIDNTKPQITTFVNGTDVYTRNLALNIQIDYVDAYAPPYAANFACLALGGGCTVDPATQYTEGCSVPYYGFVRNNSFLCNTTLASNTPDGIVAFCAKAADAAIPDNPSGNNQAQPATSANLSDQSCGSVILDRTPPAASITASATSVKVGDLVNLGAQSSDATSGTSGQYTWVFGDNTPNGSGPTTTHTYTQAGTYEAKVLTQDAAGNPGEGKQVITVSPPAQGGGTGGTGGTVTPPPTDKGIVNESGGGGTQETAFAGLEVVAPKKFKIRRGHRKLPLAVTSAGAGRFTAALALGRKVLARGAVTVTRAGRFGFNLKLPARMKAGRYKLTLSFKPKGSSTALTKVLRIRFTGGVAGGSRATPASHSRFRAS